MKFRKLLISVVCLAVVLLFAAGCKQSSSNPYFPVAAQPESTYPSALITGKLVVDGDYMRVKSGWFFAKGSLLIWPYGYSLKTADGKISVVDKDGQVVAAVGDEAKFGGGAIPLETVEKYVGKSLPANCPGPYWLVSGVVK
jgi:hypothetical protein